MPQPQHTTKSDATTTSFKQIQDTGFNTDDIFEMKQHSMEKSIKLASSQLSSLDGTEEVDASSISADGHLEQDDSNATSTINKTKQNSEKQDNKMKEKVPIKYPDYRPDDRVKSPLLTPVHRRVEVLCVLLHITSILLLSSFFFFLWCFPVLWPFLSIYAIFFYLFDKSPSNGNSPNRRVEYIRNLKIYKHVTNYFPITLHKTVDLKPTFTETKIEVDDFNVYPPISWFVPQFLLIFLNIFGLCGMHKVTKTKMVRTGPRYLFGYHPHGVIALGVACGMATEGAGVGTLLPGIKCYVTTLVNQFHFPFYRDYLMSLGVTCVTGKNIRALLRKNCSPVIVVGGASESLLAKPGSNKIVLHRRKGFIKTAIEMCGERVDYKEGESPENDICLVPVYSFGENNIFGVYYTNEEDEDAANSLNQDGHIKRVLKKCQLALKKHVGFTLPIVISRGVFNYDFGILPYRRPINVVYGEPIPVSRFKGSKRGDKATPEEVEHYHKLYVEGLQKVFNDNKHLYLTQWDSEMTIVE
ncbi:unnamed protein product [Ambrosiozyma monospora]|uniref:diacylglycerol O-acyltransferase n=1 Tax=Ambrosiozyma monospora TaxID=43982 RepID=A0A9W6YMB8_AMBMO|nr:unnamed protein product [Ambrosiozyma monospora]